MRLSLFSFFFMLGSIGSIFRMLMATVYQDVIRVRGGEYSELREILRE